MYDIAKRLIGAACALLGLILLSPLFLFLAIAIKLDSKGPVFFRQGRLGKDGKQFQMYKFRSMVVNAEGMGTGLFNYDHDPRVTKMGRILRDFSLDELPQLINVVRGDMALVGPRPPVTYELGDFSTLNARYKKRFSVPAGITGLAQISGRNELPWDEKVRIDNQYVDRIKREGLRLDAVILLKTFTKVISKEDITEVKADESIEDEHAAALAAEEVIRQAHAVEENEKVSV